MECVAEDHNGDPIDNETLFGDIDNVETPSSQPSSSFWGTKINKTGGISNYMPKYTMDSYVRTKKS
jgi:hypothetical protein